MQKGSASVQNLAKRPKVELRSRRQKWLEFVVGSRLAPTVSLRVLLFFPSMKIHFQLQSGI